MIQGEKARANAIVVGGGIVGLACAFELQTRGLATVLVDPEPVRRRASWGNAGHLAVEQVEPLASFATLASVPRRLFWRGGAVSLPPRDIGAWLPFAWRLIGASGAKRFSAGRTALGSLIDQALPAWRRITANAGAAASIVEDGHYVVWETPAGARAGQEFWRNADTGTVTLSEATRAEIDAIAALIGRRPAGVLRFIGTGRVSDPGALHERISAAFAQAGGRERDARVRRLIGGKGRAIVELADGARLDADVIVIAAGVGSGDMMQSLGVRTPIIAERGYHLQAPATAWPDMPPVVFEERSMIVSRFESGLRAASFVEFGRESSPPDARKWRRLRKHAEAMRLPFDCEPREWMGARPTLPDYLPALGRCARADNVICAFGHQHLGLTLAAASAEIVAATAFGHEPPLDLRPFSPDRF